MPVTMQSVNSSQIAKIGFDAQTKTLHVQFNNGDDWKYFDVPASTHANLMASDSVGSYFSKHIKPHYRGSKA